MPLQQELPIKCRCKTVRDKIYLKPPVLGHFKEQENENYVNLTIRLQEKLLKNTDHYLESMDQYGLLNDKYLKSLLKRMLSINHLERPKLYQILKDPFIRKYCKSTSMYNTSTGMQN